MGWHGGWHQQKLVQIEGLDHCPGHLQMPFVEGIECPAIYTDATFAARGHITQDPHSPKIDLSSRRLRRHSPDLSATITVGWINVADPIVYCF